MDAKITYLNLEQVIDLSKAGKLEHFGSLRSAITQVSSCILENYDNGQYLIPRVKDLLQSSSDDATVALLLEAKTFIDNIQAYYNPDLPDASNMLQGYSEQCLIEELLDKVKPLIVSTPEISNYNAGVATTLSLMERKQFLEFAFDCIQTCGQQTEWSADTMYMHYIIFQVMYAICKYDSLMQLFFHYANSMIDRMPSADLQTTRDFTESIIKIGYAEHMEADAYISASRAYTLCHNSIAGLFYLHIAITSIKQSDRKLSKDDVFEILWLMMKILKELPGYFDSIYNVVVRKFKDFHYSDYNVLCFMLTAFSVRLQNRQRQVVSKILDFLNEYRETIMRYMKHSNMQWHSIVCAIETIFPDLFNEQFKMYKSLFSANINPKGNEGVLDVITGKNLAQHLLKTLSQLEETRDSKDYATDNKNALLIANKLLPQAVEQSNVEDFILSMRVKSDFTYIFKDTYIKSTIRKLELSNDKPGDYKTFYRDRDKLLDYINLDPHDSMLWIGDSQGKIYYMSLKGEDYIMGELNEWEDLNVRQLSQYVSNLQYITDAQDSHECWYIKSAQEFEDENRAFNEHFGHHILPIPIDARRLLIAKDVELSGLPHQLLSSDNDSYIGEKMPSANVISTEYFILSNFDNNITADFKSNFWIPLDSEDYALNRLWSHLEPEITPLCKDVYTTKSIAEPLNSAINIVCAHGAKTVGETEWFYAKDEPIKYVDAVIGKGKMLILLVCHSGSMHPGTYDTAVHSIVKKFIRKGYNAVVAPAWSLSTEIVPLWINTFMNEFIDKRGFVIDAVYKANMAVKRNFTAISAWACMHLYGNPYLQINDQPSLTLKVNDIPVPV